MPLDARKALHLVQLVTRSFQVRQRPVVAVTQTGGVYSYTTLQVIMRPEQLFDPQVYVEPPQRTVDMLMVAPLGTNFSGVVYIADTPTPTAVAVASAPKYEIVEVLPVGILPGGSHLRVQLRRLR
jgi:hypothetical protein